MKLRIAALMMGALAVAGCASAQPHLNKGTVIGHEYNPGFWETIKACDKWVKDKPKTNTNCTHWKTHQDWDPECYRLWIQWKGYTDSVCETRVVWENYKVGDFYNAGH